MLFDSKVLIISKSITKIITKEIPAFRNEGAYESKLQPSHEGISFKKERDRKKNSIAELAEQIRKAEYESSEKKNLPD